MVAAAKLRRAQEPPQRPALRRAHGRGDRATWRPACRGRRRPAPAGRHRQDKRHLVIVATADRGLAGGFNPSIVRAARDHISGLTADGKDVQHPLPWPQGRATSCAAHYGERWSAALRSSADASVPWPRPSPSPIDAGAVRGGRGRRRHPVLQPLQIGRPRFPRAQQLVPAHGRRTRPPTGPRRRRSTNTSRTEDGILETLLPRNIAVQIFGALLENMAGFYASQMSAMDNATRNAGDMIAALTPSI